MRILHSIRSVNPEGGGVVEAVRQVSRIHQEAGHSVEVISLDAPEDQWVREFPLKITAAGPAVGKFGFSRRLVPWLRSRAAGYDAIVVNGLWQYHSYGVWRALRGTRTPYCVFPHGMLDPWFRRAYPFKHLKKWLYWPWSDYRVLRDARATVYTSEEERRLARQSFWLYRCNEKVAALGVAAPGGDPARQQARFLERFPELRGKRLVLFLGRLHEKKGCDLLLRAFAGLLRNPPPMNMNPATLQLVMAGPDQTGWLPALRQLAEELQFSDRVTWTGMLGGDVKLGASRAAEVFVLPSHQENFGLAVAESLACSVPVLISNKVNIWREIEADGAGLVDNDDAAGALRLLTRWFALPPEEQRACRALAQQCFARRFEIHQAARGLIDLLGDSNRGEGT